MASGFLFASLETLLMASVIVGFAAGAFRHGITASRRIMCSLASSSPSAMAAAAAPSPSLPDMVHGSLFAASEPGKQQRLAVIVLNNLKHDGNKHFFRHAWSSATMRLCADGGANGLYDALQEQDRERYLPHVIKGDLDSLRPDVKRYYGDKGVDILQAADQDHNDFEKCLREVLVRAGSAAPATTVVAVGAFGGRFDQEMAAFHLLHQYTAQFGRFLLLGNGNLSYLLLPGRTHRIRPHHGIEGPTCGLIPVGVPCGRVTTRGLRWDMTDQSLGFGTFISSSNEVAAGAAEVRVVTDTPLVWTIEVTDPREAVQA